jgi:hypothetical protein
MLSAADTNPRPHVAKAKQVFACCMKAKRKRKSAQGQNASRPSRWRLQHGDFSEPLRIPDPETGTPVILRRPRTLLDRMVDAGTITSAMRQAGEDFHRSFRLAALDPLRAHPLLRLPTSTGDSMAERVEAACHRVARALAALGGQDSPAGSCVWHVIGYEMSIREWATRCGWSGRAMGHSQAQGVLVAALGVLARHYGLDASQRSNPGMKKIDLGIQKR